MTDKNNLFAFSALLGGVEGCLNAKDGTLLKQDDKAWTASASAGVYFHTLVENSGLTENSPFVIKPLTNAGLKRWHLLRQATEFILMGTTVPVSTQGVQGDVYLHYTLDGSIWDVYGPKAGNDSEWGNPVSMIGPPGIGAWHSITDFTATPYSTSTLDLTADLSATVPVGSSLEYVIGGTTYYGQVYAVSTSPNQLVVNGPPLSGDVTSLKYGGGVITQLPIPINGFYEDADSSTVVASKGRYTLPWLKATSYIVGFQASSIVHDGGATHGFVNVLCNGQTVSTSNTNKGLEIAGNGMVYKTAVDIDPTHYQILNEQFIEVKVAKGSSGDAQDLSLTVVLITPVQ